jgi:GTPase SAR1 family protein
MKKIPGTLFQIKIVNSKQDQNTLQVHYRDQLVHEKSGLIKDALLNEIQSFLETKNLVIPRNRIEWILKEELAQVSPSKQTFIEGTVSTMIDEFQKKPKDEVKKIILIGLSNAGKTCIYERVFEGKKPYELLHSAATKGITYKEYDVGSLTKPMIWDLGGQQQYLDEYHGVLRSNIFKKASILLYVVDITDSERYEKSRGEFEWSVNQMLSFNPDANINVFFHKIDLVQNKDEIVNYLKNYFSQNISHKIYFHLTSIFGQSLFSAWSEIIRELSPKSTFINSILKSLKKHAGVQDAVLLDKTSGLACGSTLEVDEEEIAVGMLSLLIVTIDKVTMEMKLDTFREFKLKTDANSLLLNDITDNLLLVIILTSPKLNKQELKEIEESGKEVSRQLNKLWAY